MSTNQCLINLLPSHINRFAKTRYKSTIFSQVFLHFFLWLNRIGRCFDTGQPSSDKLVTAPELNETTVDLYMCRGNNRAARSKKEMQEYLRKKMTDVTPQIILSSPRNFPNLKKTSVPKSTMKFLHIKWTVER